jgi:hypothetical protein
METEKLKKSFLSRLKDFLLILKKVLKSPWFWFAVLLLLDFAYCIIFVQNTYLYPKAEKIIWVGFITLTILTSLAFLLALIAGPLKLFSKKKDENSS